MGRDDPPAAQEEAGLTFERSYAVPIATVWDAWTRPELLRAWWGPEKTVIADCEVDTSTIQHVNEVTLAEHDGRTVLNLRIRIIDIASGARMAAFGMKWGSKAQLDKLDALLASDDQAGP